MAIKYLAGDRLIGTAAERTGMTTSTGGWTVVGDGVTFNESTKIISNDGASSSGGDRIYQQLSETLGNTWVCKFEWTRATSTGNDVRPLGFSSTTDQPQSDGGSGHDWIGAYGDTNANVATTVNGTHTPLGWMAMAQNTKQYMIMRRESDTEWELRNYGTDSTYSTLDTSGGTNPRSMNPNAGTVTNLQYVMCSNNAGSGAHHRFDIENIKVYNDTTSLTPSSSDLIFDSDTSGVVYTYPNLEAGTIFEESDTGKHYMWDGSSAWNEVA